MASPGSRRFVRTGGQSDQCGSHIVQQAGPVTIDRPTAGDEDIVMARQAMKRQQLPRSFAHSALGAVALNGAADLACRREAHADARTVVRPAQDLDRHAAARQRAALGAREKLPTLLQFVDNGDAFPDRGIYGVAHVFRRI